MPASRSSFFLRLPAPWNRLYVVVTIAISIYCSVLFSSRLSRLVVYSYIYRLTCTQLPCAISLTSHPLISGSLKHVLLQKLSAGIGLCLQCVWWLR